MKINSTARDCYNPVTLDLDDIEAVPPEQYFRSDSHHGFHIDDVVQWATKQGAWTNPYTGLSLSDNDVRRLRDYPAMRSLFVTYDHRAAALITSAMQKMRLGRTEAARRDADQALRLTPDNDAVKAFHATVYSTPAAPLKPQSAATRSTRDDAPPPRVPLPSAASSSAPHVAGLSRPTVHALRQLGQTTAIDAGSFSDSAVAMCSWRSYADALDPAARQELDAQIKIFDLPFWHQFDRASVAQLGVNDLGRELLAALERLPHP